MAFHWGTGFELQSAATEVELPLVLGSPTISTAVKRSGASALKISSLTSGARMGFRPPTPSGAGPFYYQRCLCVETLPSAANRIALWNNTSDENSPLFWIALESNGTLTFHDEDGQIGSASSALTVDGSTFYYIEIKYDITGGAGAGILEAKLNGVTFASSTTRSIGANVTSASVGGNLAFEAQTVGVWYFDDLLDLDGTGSYMNTFPGGAKIIHLKPDGAGDNSNWSGSFADIDEVPPDDATTFISEGPAADTIDVTLEATPGAIGASDTINGVFVGHRASLDDAGGSDPRYVIRLKAAPGGTTDESSVFFPNQTTWYTNQTASRLYPAIGNNSNYEQPGGSSAWTKSALDTAQIGARISTTDTSSVRITAMWLLVVFTPAGGHTVTVNQIEETDTAQTITRNKAKAIGQVSETDLAQALNRLKTLVVAQASETDVAQPVQWKITRLVNQATETDVAQPVQWKITRLVNQATETDLAQPITVIGVPPVVGGGGESGDTGGGSYGDVYVDRTRIPVDLGPKINLTLRERQKREDEEVLIL